MHVPVHVWMCSEMICCLALFLFPWCPWDTAPNTHPLPQYAHRDAQRHTAHMHTHLHKIVRTQIERETLYILYEPPDPKPYSTPGPGLGYIGGEKRGDGGRNIVRRGETAVPAGVEEEHKTSPPPLGSFTSLCDPWPGARQRTFHVWSTV